MSAAGTPIAPKTTIQGQLIFDEIQMIVAEAIAAGGTLRTAPHVKRLSKVYEGAGFSKERITNEIIIAAATGGIAVEIQSPG